jgi:hypothetical protein
MKSIEPMDVVNKYAKNKFSLSIDDILKITKGQIKNIIAL